MAPRKLKDENQLHELKAQFLADFSHHRKWLKEIQDDERFYDGEQWTAEEKRDLEERGQPVITLNRVKPKIDALVGAEMGRPVDLKAFPRGLRDFEQAKHITEALRYCEYHMDFDSIENEAFRKQLVASCAWYELIDCWDRDTYDHDVKCRLWSVHDIIRDRHSFEADLSDCMRLHKTEYTRQDSLKLLFPKKERWIENVVLDEPGPFNYAAKHRSRQGDQYDNAEALEISPQEAHGLFVRTKEKQIRVVTTFTRIPFVERYLSIPAHGTECVTKWDEKDVQKAKDTYQEVIEYSELRYELNSTTYIWNHILEEKKNIVPWDKSARYRFVMIPGMEFQDRRRKGQYVGLVRGMKDVNKEINKRRSKAMHLLNTNLIIRDEGAVENPAKARSEANRPDGDIVKRQGFQFEIVRNTELAAGQFQLLAESKAEIDSVGVRSEVQGGSRATSGRDFQLRHEVSSHPVRPYLRNLRDAKRRFFMLVLDRIQQFWVAPRLVKITDDPQAAAVQLNRVVQTDAGPVVVNNVSVGKYDIILEEVPENVNLENEAYKDLLQLSGIMAQQGQPVPLDTLIELSPFPHKQKLLERLAGGGNAPPADVAANGGEFPMN